MNEFMELAKSEAIAGIRNREGGPFGAVIVRDGKVIASAHNTVTSSHDASAHAEINAIRAAGKALKTHDLSGCEIYTTGKPCPMCHAALEWANIKTIYYALGYDDTADIGFRDDSISHLLKNPEKDKKMKQIDRENCIDLYEEWKTMKTKKMY